ncbi:MAG TPA: barstar family protein [Edaphobacter sp.]|jgi:RNAse (barnase) inhibitor barstar|nr:barstar family protein [Edaphobacter sp.]
MAWQVALVLDTQYSINELSALTHQMPVWAIETPERQEAASSIRGTAGDMWAPDPGFTLFTPSSKTDRETTCAHVLGTLLEHHPNAACLELIGVPITSTLIEILSKKGFEAAANNLHEGLPFRKPLEKFTNVHELILDACQWKSPDDLYTSFFEAVGAPAWHGKNFNALKESIVTGDINQIEVPYRIVIKNFNRVARSIRSVTEEFVQLIEKFESAGCPVAIRILEGEHF